ncbi:TDT family transporter [[Clostridium] colinum]|uniref:TDT family transporter n=1 Tax=[Clostridium] colinum TaxID=36835 RepID=UPI0020244668|nr:TDT family transporter [[Clostridium] colinum]
MIKIRRIIDKTKHIPLPVVPCMLGACTLSNVYNGLGFSFIRHLTVFFAILVVLSYITKIIMHPTVIKEEYKNPVTCSLYPGICMVSMVIGSYFYDYSTFLGKTIWIIAIVFHSIHIFLFTYLHFIKSRDINTFLPTWFVTYNGIMVSSVVGDNMQADKFLTFIVYYGILIYFLILPVMVWRLLKFEIKDTMQHGTAILLGPCSLCIVSYINIIKNLNIVLVWILYICVLLSLLYVLVRLPKFFSYAFTPAFAGLTFPMAIGTVATQKMVFYLNNTGYESIASIFKQLEGIQIYITTAIIGFVLFNFVRLLRLHFVKEL